MKRNCRFELRLSKDEFSELTKKARKARLSNAAFVRRAIRNQEVKEAPPVDVPYFIQEIKRIGNSMNQIAKVANAQKLVDVPLLRKTISELHAVLDLIVRAYAAEV